MAVSVSMTGRRANTVANNQWCIFSSSSKCQPSSVDAVNAPGIPSLPQRPLSLKDLEVVHQLEVY